MSSQIQPQKPSTQQIVSVAADKLLDALSHGRSEAMADYLRVMERFHRYSFNNVLLIAQQRPTASHVCGFKAWLSLDRHVRKGEKGIQILAPIIGKKKADDAAPEDDWKESQVFGFRAVYVFDLAQTDGEDLPTAPSIQGVQGDAAAHLNTLLEFIRQQGIAVEFSEQIAPALGVSYGGRILLAPGHSEAETIVTLVHEYAHESMHKSDRRASTTKTVRETEAEAVAFVVCSGLDCGSSSSDYIGLHDGNADTLIASLGIVQKTACQILDALSLPAG